MARTLEAAGLPAATASHWESRIVAGDFLVGAHVKDTLVDDARTVMQEAGGREVSVGTWPD
jgi:hypothetical protein